MNNDISTRTVDPAIETVIAGSSGSTVVQFPQKNSDTDSSEPQENSVDHVNSALNDMKTALLSSTSLKDQLDAIADVENKVDSLHNFGHNRVYDMLEGAFNISQTAYTTRKSEWRILAAQRGIELNPDAKNKYTRVCKLIWGRWEKCEKTGHDKWVHIRSGEKYANVFHHLDENIEEVKRKGVANYIRSYDHEKYGKGLSGIVKADRSGNSQNSSTAPTSEQKKIEVIEVGEKLCSNAGPKPFATVKCPPHIQTEVTGIVYLAARVEGEDLHLLGNVKVSDAMVLKDLKRIADPKA